MKPSSVIAYGRRREQPARATSVNSGMTLLEVMIASGIFVIFVAAALAAGTSANNQDRLNASTMELLEDTGRLQTFLAEEFARVAPFELRNPTTGKGSGTYYPAASSSLPIPPNPSDPLVAGDTTVYSFSYIKLRSHVDIQPDPANLKQSHVKIANLNAAASRNPLYNGVDGAPVSMLNYINANPTPFMIYDPMPLSSDAWWVRPQWETWVEGHTFADNCNPDMVRVYSLELRPSNSTWANLDPGSTAAPYVELGDLVRTFRNGASSPTSTAAPLLLATGIDRRSYSLTLSSNFLTLRFRQHRIVTRVPWLTISRPFEMVVRLPSIPP